MSAVRSLRPTWIVLLAVPPLVKIGTLFLTNVVGFPHPERLVALFLVAWAGSLILVVVLVASGVGPKVGTYGVFVASSGFWFLGGMVRQRGLSLTLITLATLVLLTVWLTPRQQMSSLVDGLVVAVSVALLSGCVIAGIQSVESRGASTLERPQQIAASLEGKEKPNVWLVLIDGYPSSATLEIDLGVQPSDQLSNTLRNEGFATPANAWSGYASTRLALSSILEMDYIATDWEENLATIGDLYSRIGGENQLFQILDDSGYQLHMIEAGWSGGGCGPRVDVCTHSKVHDGAMNVLLHDSLLTDLPSSSPGYHFAIGNKATMARLLDFAASNESDSPFLLFAHLVAPHPPLFLDDGCELVVAENRMGFFYPYPGVDGVVRDQLFRGQMTCVDSFLVDLAAEVSADDVLIFVSDHGTGRRAQVFNDPSRWSDAAVRERMGVLVAVRSSTGCNLPEPYVTVNLMRSVLSCLGDTEISLLEPRLFPGPDFELDPERVDRLLHLGSE